MGLIEQTVVETIENHNWDFYRDNYREGNYSYEDLIAINNCWYPLIREQVFFHPAWAKRFFQQFKNSVCVLELGCYQGELAKAMLDLFPNIKLWDGMDICNAALNNPVAPLPFRSIHLHKPFEDFPINHYDVFVSTHTLEHMVWDEVKRVFEKIHFSKILHVFLELPVKEHGKVWRGGGSSHVLSQGRRHIRDWFLKMSWKVEWEVEKGMDWAISLRR